MRLKQLSDSQDRLGLDEMNVSSWGDFFSVGYGLHAGERPAMASAPEAARFDAAVFREIFDYVMPAEPIDSFFAGGSDWQEAEAGLGEAVYAAKDVGGFGELAAAVLAAPGIRDSQFDFFDRVVLSFEPHLDMFLPEAGSDVAPASLWGTFGF